MSPKKILKKPLNFFISILYEPCNHKAYGYQVLHVALSSGPSSRSVNYNPRVELTAKGYKFYMGLYSEIFGIFLLLNIRTVATNFSPCKRSYVLNQFPSNVMFGMNVVSRISQWGDTGPSLSSCLCVCEFADNGFQFVRVLFHLYVIHPQFCLKLEEQKILVFFLRF